MFKVKISPENITYGPKTFDVDPVVAMTIAGQLLFNGYRKTSNAYCQVSRIDCDDWLDVLAKEMNCARADFMCVNGGGVEDHWRDYYIRVYSRDNLTVSPAVLKFMKKSY